MRGLFITLEGTEGAGKSSMIPVVKRVLEESGRQVVCVREPGGTPIAEKIREILKTPADEKLNDKAELLLMYAARAQLVETVIRPTLAKGVDVISDRHDLSTIAYQGGGRKIPLSLIDKARQVALGDFHPDLTILMDIDPYVGMQRAKGRGALDRFEQEQMAFFERVRNTYLDCAKNDASIVVVNAALDLKTVTYQVESVIKGVLAHAHAVA